MTLVRALEKLKEKGITRLTGLDGVHSIDIYIDNARLKESEAAYYKDTSWAKYKMDCADNYFIVELDNGHFIIATHYDEFDMATYSTHSNDNAMLKAFDEWCIAREAEAVADELVLSRPNELSHSAWVYIITNELRQVRQITSDYAPAY